MCGSLSTDDRTEVAVSDAPLRAARGANYLDLVYGPKWFRTESISLTEIEKALSLEFLFENQGDTYESFTSKLQAKTAIAEHLMLDGDEIDGWAFGFYGEGRELRKAWAAEIRTRRYNRPSKRRVSPETARETRSIRKAVN